MTKRKNLLKKLSIGVLTLGSGAISLNSLENLPLKDKTDLIVEGYIYKIPGDKLSDSYYSSEGKILLDSVEKKIEKFYDSNFDINVSFSNPSELDKNSLNKKNVSIEYMTMEKMLENPREVLYFFGGQELIDDLEKEIGRAQKVEGWNYETAEKVIFDTVKEGFYDSFSGEGGFGSEDCHRAWVFPSKIYERNSNNSDELSNAYAFSMSHELGHVLGLEHTNGTKNFMNPRINLEDVLNFDIEMNYSQIEQIKDYLNKD